MTDYSLIRAHLHAAIDNLWRAESAGHDDRMVLLRRAYDMIGNAGTNLAVAEPDILNPVTDDMP